MKPKYQCQAKKEIINYCINLVEPANCGECDNLKLVGYELEVKEYNNLIADQKRLRTIEGLVLDNWLLNTDFLKNN